MTPGMVLVVYRNRSFLNEVANEIAIIAHRGLAVFQGTFKDSWATAKMAEFMAVQQKPRYRVLRVVKDWETGTAYRGGGVVSLPGGETPTLPCPLPGGGGERPVGGIPGERGLEGAAAKY